MISQDVENALRTAPQLTVDRGWTVSLQGDTWVVTATPDAAEPDHEQPHLVSCGGAVERVVIALQARGHRVHVELFPVDRPSAVATVEVIGPGPATSHDLALLAACRPPDTPAPAAHAVVTPSDLRQLNLAPEAFGVEVLWSSEVATRRDLQGLQRVHSSADARPMATLVTPADGPDDWVRAGRALAHLLLRVTELGLTAHLEPHAMRRRSTREAVRTAWSLEPWPQVQLSLGPVVELEGPPQSP